MKCLIIGSTGQLGTDIVTGLNGVEQITPSHTELDVTNRNQVADYVENCVPDVVINSSAFGDVPLCETKVTQAFEINAAGPLYLGLICQKLGIPFYHVSTDYVYSGDKGSPYDVNDPTFPQMVYGASKLAGDQLALAKCAKTRIVRTTGLFGVNPCRSKPGGRNFIETMLYLAKTKGEVKVVNDQFCCPTYTKDLGRLVAGMVKNDVPPGIYHGVTPPGCSWFEFASIVFDVAGVAVKLTPVSQNEFPVPFKRPTDSRLVLRAGNIGEENIMNPLRKAVEDYFNCRG